MSFDGKVCLVTGGTGFVGTHFVIELLKTKAKIRVPIHIRPMIVQDSNVDTLKADLTRLEDCLIAMEGVDYVFHCAGAVAAAAVTAGNPMAAINTNLLLTARVLEAAWMKNVRRILIFSSSTVYPVANYPIKEEEMWSGPTHESYFGYGWMRRYLEKMAEFVATKTNIGVALVRPTAVYGRYDNFDPVTSHVIPALIRKSVERISPYEVWGTGDEVRDFLHVSDLARGCLMVMDKHAICDPVNIGYGRTVTIKNIVHAILKAAGYEDAEIVYNSSKPTAIPFRMVDIEKAKRILGFEPQISLEEGLADTVKWYQDQVSARNSNKK